MAEQKPGFFRRLLGETQAEPAVQPSPAETPGPPEMRPPTSPPPKQSWFQRLASGLKRSSDQLTGGIASVFTKKRLDNAMLEELEDILIQADFGLDTTEAVIETLRRDRFTRHDLRRQMGEVTIDSSCQAGASRRVTSDQ